MLDLGYIVEHIPGLLDLILFWANDVSVVHVSRCGLTHGTLSDERVLALILTMMTGGLLKMVSNWAVLTTGIRAQVPQSEPKICLVG
jgi:hypothetical protein